MLSHMEIASVSSGSAVVEFSRGEVLALRNLLVYAPHVPFEIKGPVAIFERLLADFEALSEDMKDEA